MTECSPRILVEYKNKWHPSFCVFQVFRNSGGAEIHKVYGGEAWKDWNAKSEGSPASLEISAPQYDRWPWWYLEMTVQAPLGTCFIQYTGKGAVGASSTALRRPWTKVTIWSLPIFAPSESQVRFALVKQFLSIYYSWAILLTSRPMRLHWCSKPLISAPLWWNSQDIYCPCVFFLWLTQAR